MEISFETIADHTIPVNDFSLNWRFIENLPLSVANQLKPLNQTASTFLNAVITDKRLHQHMPFKKGFFNKVEKIKITGNNDDAIRGWLSALQIPLDKQVFLSWDNSTNMIAPWGLVIQYFDDFYYPSSDDLTIFDQTLNWAVLFSHSGVVYYGTK